MCGTLSLWFWKDHAVRVFEKSAEENIRCKELWRRLHKELNSFYLSPVTKWWRIRWEESVARMGQMANRILFFGYPDVYHIFLALVSNPVIQNRMPFIVECDLLFWTYSFSQTAASSNIIPNFSVCLILGLSSSLYTIYSESNFRFIAEDCWRQKRTAQTTAMLSAEQLSIYERLIDVFLEVYVSCHICNTTLNLSTSSLSLKKTRL